MPILQFEEINSYIDVVDFIKTHKLEKEFKKRYEVEIDNWLFEEGDFEVMCYFIEQWKDNYTLEYIEEGSGYFILRKYNI